MYSQGWEWLIYITSQVTTQMSTSLHYWEQALRHFLPYPHTPPNRSWTLREVLEPSADLASFPSPGCLPLGPPGCMLFLPQFPFSFVTCSSSQPTSVPASWTLNSIHACCLSFFYLWDHKNDHFCFHVSSITFSMIFYMLIGSLFLSINGHTESIKSWAYRIH